MNALLSNPFKEPGILLYKYLGPTCARTDTLTPSSYCCH